MRTYPFLFFLLMLQSLMTQTTLDIALINDRIPEGALEIEFENNIKEEISLLLQQRYEVNFNTYYKDQNSNDFSKIFATAYIKNDILITLGIPASSYAARLEKYPKPTIASLILDPQLQGVEKTVKGSSGIENFTYLESPFDIKRDLNLLNQVYPFDQLEVISEKGSIGHSSIIEQLFSKYLAGKNVTINHNYFEDIINGQSIEKKGKKIAVYALPYLDRTPSQIKSIFQTLIENKIPSAGLLGEDYLAAGALIGYKTKENLLKIPRHIALSVMKIVEGQNAADLSVEVQAFGENLLINMETARQIDVYPSFEIMSKGTLLNLDNVQTENKLTLQKAIAQGLQNNLAIKIEQTDVSLANTEIGIAKSNLLPQVDFSSSLSLIDEPTTLSRQGTQGRANWLASGGLSQVIFSEPTLANLAIQKMLKESEEAELLQTQLDVIIDVTNAYMNILFAKSNLNIQQQNVARNKENYDISKAKETIGYSGTSDLNRWEAELANANIDLNSAIAGLRQSKYQLNQLLNLPVNEVVSISEATLEESLLMIADERMQFINDYGALNKFSNFLVGYAMENLPELTQIDLGLKVQERSRLSNQRALYLPSLVMSGSASRVLQKFNIPEGLPDAETTTSWDIGVGLSYPLFQGNNRRKQVEKSKLNIDQLQHTRKNVANQLEFIVRSNLENVGVSYSRMRLAKIAAEASQKNYVLIQDAYSAGQSNVTNLIDAQNNALASSLSATNAVYTFIQDFLNLERSIGHFNFLATTAERDVFFQNIQQHFIQK